EEDQPSCGYAGGRQCAGADGKDADPAAERGIFQRKTAVPGEGLAGTVPAVEGTISGGDRGALPDDGGGQDEYLCLFPRDDFPAERWGQAGGQRGNLTGGRQPERGDQEKNPFYHQSQYGFHGIRS